MAEAAGTALIVDLDGTLYRGDAPVRSYARHAGAGLDPDRAAELVAELDRYLAGGPVDGLPPHAVDGWEAVQLLATERFGLTREVLDAAFLRSRQDLADGSNEVSVPAGLADLLAELRGPARIVLATNSPRDGLPELLARLGVAGAFDEIVPGAAKPAGLPALLARQLAAVGATGEPYRAFSIGDHWRNDIEPALRAGTATGYVDRFGRRDGAAHVTAPTVSELLPAIRSWATDPAGFVAAHPVPDPVQPPARRPGPGVAEAGPPVRTG